MSLPLENRRVLLGVTGSIAAYKAADLASQLTHLGADVHVVLTGHASKFVGAATFRALTRNPVVEDLFDEPNDKRIAHIQLAQDVDLILIAPATANILAKMATGIADDMLSTLLLAAKVPIVVAPAMNTAMFVHPATQSNMALLRERGVVFVEPVSGVLACGDEGTGKLAPIQDIVEATIYRIVRRRDMSGVRVVVSAGATREPLDPVRYISNRSSGKMGCMIAEAAKERGATVTLIAANMTAIPPTGVEVVKVNTTEDLLEASLNHFRRCHLFVAAAAPADYAPVTVSPQKMKKSGGDDLTIHLRETPDIAAALGGVKQSHVLVGFAAETENLIDNAAKKLEKKRLDLIVANDVSRTDSGFEVDTNKTTLLWPDGKILDLPLIAKRALADLILDEILPQLPPRDVSAQ